jgi:diguanylate cyclase (GGDEF)-like protein
MNRGAGLRRLDLMASRIRTQKGDLSLLFLDLDHFKEINDQYGHLHGDACLRAVVGAVGRELRQRDVLVRFGGEEFVVALPGAASEDAAMVAERIRRGVEANCRRVAGQTHELTVSVGVASYDRDRDRVRDLLERGDAALYRAKSEGRNRVVVGLRRGSGPVEFVPGPGAPGAVTAAQPSEV